MKNYLIIGASHGIGNVIAKNLLEFDDVSVFGTYRSGKPNIELNGIQWIHYDSIHSETDFAFLPESLHGFVYCPGTIQLKPFGRFTESDFLNDYRSNVLGFINTLQAVLPRLKKSGQGSILTFSSVAVQTGLAFHSIVGASKGAIEGLTRSLAAELAPSIRVNCIAPSLTETSLASTLLNTHDKREAAAQRHPLKRIGSAEDIASAALFLLNNSSGWITGQIIHVDGGIGSIR
jgi:NAD(P)-dependent dehydrogenase (short-subunit alcohol dehydrogenase family)